MVCSTQKKLRLRFIILLYLGGPGDYRTVRVLRCKKKRKTQVSPPGSQLLQCVPCDPELDSRQHRTSVPVVLRLTSDTTRCPRNPVAPYDRTLPSTSRCKTRQMSRVVTTVKRERQIHRTYTSKFFDFKMQTLQSGILVPSRALTHCRQCCCIDEHQFDFTLHTVFSPVEK